MTVGRGSSGSEGCGDGGYDGALLFFGELRINRKREYFPAGVFRFGKISLGVFQVFECFLQVQRNRVIDFRGDSLGAKFFAKSVAVLYPDCKLIVDMGEVGGLFGADYFSGQMKFFEKAAVTCRVSAAGLVPIVQVAKFDAEDGGLQGVEATVQAEDFVDVSVAGSVKMEELEAPGDGSIVGGDHAAIACAAEIF